MAGGAVNRLVLPLSREDIADYLALSVEIGKAFADPAQTPRCDMTDRDREIRILDRKALTGDDENQSANVRALLVTQPASIVRRLAYSDYD